MGEAAGPAWFQLCPAKRGSVPPGEVTGCTRGRRGAGRKGKGLRGAGGDPRHGAPLVGCCGASQYVRRWFPHPDCFPAVTVKALGCLEVIWHCQSIPLIAMRWKPSAFFLFSSPDPGCLAKLWGFLLPCTSSEGMQMKTKLPFPAQDAFLRASEAS